MKGLIFTYILTYGGAVASLFNPYIGFLIYVCFSIIRPEAMWHWAFEGGGGNYSRIVAVALLAGWALYGLGSWRFGKAKPVVYALLAFWGLAILSAAAARNSQVAWDFIEDKSKVFLPFIVGITLINSERRLKHLGWVLVFSQGYVAFELNLAYYGGFNKAAEFGFGGIDNNGLAIPMVAGAGLAFFMGLFDKPLWRRLLCFAAAGLMVHTVLFTFSRGGMLALCIMGGVAAYFIYRHPKYWWALALGLIIGVRLAGDAVVARFSTVFVDAEELDNSAKSRIDLWTDCIDVMTKNPLLGVGPDHWRQIAHTYGWPEGKDAHTLWLQTGAELGVPALLCLLTFYGVCMVQLFRLARKRDDPTGNPYYAAVGVMVITATLGFMIAAQFVNVLGLEYPYFIVLFGCGALKLSSIEKAAEPDEWDEEEDESEEDEADAVESDGDDGDIAKPREHEYVDDLA